MGQYKIAKEEIKFNENVIPLVNQGVNRICNLTQSDFESILNDNNLFQIDLAHYQVGHISIKIHDWIIDSPLTLQIKEDQLYNEKVSIHIEFKKCQFVGVSTNIFGTKYNENQINITFDSCVIGMMNFLNWKFKLIHFNHCLINEGIQFEDNINLHEVVFVNSIGGNNSISKECNVRITLTADFLRLKKQSDPTSFEIDSVDQIEIIGPYQYNRHEVLVFPKFHFNISSPNHLSCNKIYIRYFEFESLKLQNLTIKELKINHSKSNYVIFNSLEVQLFRLEELTFGNNKSEFHLIDSQVDKFQWLKVDLKKLKILNIYKTDMSDVMLSDTDFPSIIESKMWGEEDTTSDSDRAELYRQLKLSAEKMKNIFLINKFNASLYDAKRKDMTLGWETRTILKLNYYTNNHGNSVKRALGLIILLNFLFACISVWILKSSYCAIFEYGSYTLRNFFVFINLSSSYDDLRINEITLEFPKFLYAIFVIMKIVNLWLAFQFVVAFRRFGK